MHPIEGIFKDFYQRYIRICMTKLSQIQYSPKIKLETLVVYMEKYFFKTLF